MWSEMPITMLMSCSISRIDDVLLLADAEQQLRELGRLARVEAGGGLVEAQQARLGAHGAGDLELALVAVGQGAGVPVGLVGQAGALEPVAARARSPPAPQRGRRRGPSRPSDTEAGRPHQPVVLRHDQILERGHGGEQADVLEGAREPLARDAEAVDPLEQRPGRSTPWKVSRPTVGR